MVASDSDSEESVGSPKKTLYRHIVDTEQAKVKQHTRIDVIKNRRSSIKAVAKVASPTKSSP